MKIYISFGQAHVHEIGEQVFDKDCIAVIECESVNVGRDKAFDIFGQKWSMQYSEEKITAEFMKFFPRGLMEV